MDEPEVRYSRVVADRTVTLVGENSRPLPGIHVVRVASNGTYLEGRTNEAGEWSFSDPFSGTVTLLAAGEGLAGVVAVMEDADWDGPLELRVISLASGGSLIIRQGTGHVPGLSGRLNPIRDTHGRLYIYGDNLSFNESSQQPFHFSLDMPFSAVDATGATFELTVLAILGHTSLIRYKLVAASPLDAEGTTPGG